MNTGRKPLINLSVPSVKYLGKQNGFAGGSYLNLTSGVELQPCQTSGYVSLQNTLADFA
jgi:hypothetical protein